MHAPLLTPDILLRAYAEGLFPMAERHDDAALYWISPEKRGIFPLDAFHVPKRLARTVRSDKFTVTTDTAFAEIMRACAAPGKGREETWINDEILRLYTALHAGGHAHSLECWRDGKLVGGLYGVRLGGAFFGESMFSRERDASKIALVHLVARLKYGGFKLLDAQFLTEHLARFGAIEISRKKYLAVLGSAVATPAYWPAPSGNVGMLSSAPALGETGLTGATATTEGCWPGAVVLQLITQTS
ncbi:MAG: leucyl/phenylalanyl-tRNA--protein transferase [Alphaproteobacteria bacterium]|nr:leucyl/phenylalanyl-tRNA--protein transferase [Alphaproteobacteria bacterium]MDE2110827.1 leucyl/phenylalanyl-tRNA--protein transferase [Alphaproteobacteria bacterium]